MIKKDGLADMKVQLVIQHKGKAKKDDELQSNTGYTSPCFKLLVPSKTEE